MLGEAGWWPVTASTGPDPQLQPYPVLVGPFVSVRYYGYRLGEARWWPVTASTGPLRGQLSKLGKTSINTSSHPALFWVVAHPIWHLYGGRKPHLYKMSHN